MIAHVADNQHAGSVDFFMICAHVRPRSADLLADRIGNLPVAPFATHLNTNQLHPQRLQMKYFTLLYQLFAP